MAQRVIEQNKYYDVIVDDDYKLLIYKWKEAIMELLQEEYKAGFLQAVKFVEEYKPKYVIHDSSTQVYPITPDLQKWISEEISPRFEKAGVKRIAYVMPQDFLSKMALEQLIMKLLSIKPGLKRIFVTDMDQAMKWILKKEKK